VSKAHGPGARELASIDRALIALGAVVLGFTLQISDGFYRPRAYPSFCLALACAAVGDVADVLRFGDDLGTNGGPFMSPAMYRRYFKPRHATLCDYVHRHITFGYEHARRTRTAWEAYNEGVGVCRDYAHLAITLCRCLNIPARYCTGYLGDYGTPQPWGTMDFAGWFEAFLGDRWHTFDARNNTPRIGRVLIARGRDACDVALSSTFGPNTLERFKVWTDVLEPTTSAA